MRETIRHNIKTPYSLHDMNVITFEVNGDDLTIRTQSGMVQTTAPYRQPDGHVKSKIRPSFLKIAPFTFVNPY